MKVAKSVFLGSAAALVAIAGAQAADLPVKAAPAEYVKICPTALYGVGFYYIPGTQTCVRLGGYVRSELNFNAGGFHALNVNGPMAQYVRTGDAYFWRTRFAPSWDVRTQTEYGTLRIFTELYFNFDSPHANGPAGAHVAQLNRGFIQFAGFTFGKLSSAVTAPWAGLPGTSSGRFLGADDSINANGLHYTAQFGNGVSATIGLEDAPYRQQNIFNMSSAIGNPVALATANGNGGSRFPDIVGNIQVNQAWGTAFLGAHATQKFPAYFGTFENTGSPGSEWGFAVTAGLNLKLPQLGAGDQLWVEGTWTRGVLFRLTGALPFNTVGIFDGSPVSQGVTFGYLADAAYRGTAAAPFDMELTTGWGMGAGIEHYWVPGRLRSSLFGSYTAIDYSDQANAWLCASFGRTTPGLAVALATPTGTFGAANTCDFDLNFWQVGTRTIWTPVAGLDFTAEVIYTGIDQKHSGVVTVPAAGWGLKAPGTYTLQDGNVISGMLRVQRTW